MPGMFRINSSLLCSNADPVPSWYTSQELGVALFSKDVASEVKKSVDEGLEGRVEYVC